MRAPCERVMKLFAPAPLIIVPAKIPPPRAEISHGKKNENKKMTWPPRDDKSYYGYSDYSSGGSSRRPRGYSPPRRGSASNDSEIRRLRDENARLRLENDELRQIIEAGKY